MPLESLSTEVGVTRVYPMSSINDPFFIGNQKKNSHLIYKGKTAYVQEEILKQICFKSMSMTPFMSTCPFPGGDCFPIP